MLIRRHPFSWRNALDAAASVSMILVAGFIIFGGRGTPTTERRPKPAVRVPAEPISFESLATKGADNAGVGVIIYSDFQCPFCRRFALEVLPVLERDLIDTGELVLAFAHLPLASIHPEAVAAAALAECGHRAGVFWRTHDRLFSVAPLSKGAINAIASDVASAAGAECLKNEGAARVDEHLVSAKALGITSTPTLLLGTVQEGRRLLVKRALTGLQSADALAAIVRALRSGVD